MVQRVWKLLDILEETSRFFAARGLENARLQAELLLAAVLDIKRLDLYLQFERPLHTEEVDVYRDYVRQRVQRVPVQYILGATAFRELELTVTPAVLIPRPETEVLVDVALELLPTGGRALDLCCGSGAIALSLKRELAEVAVVATDISQAALAVARANGASCELEIEWLSGDLFAAVEGDFDLVVSNPPYVKSGDLDRLEPEVRDHEPRLALDGGADGLDCYRRIAHQASDHIRPGGYLLLEVGDGQSAEVEKLLAEVGRFAEVETKPDLNEVPRVVVARASST
ncbi:peptide chain release factor N(5)-glutamine methyltransferase [bacterium]|nr:protein-(glutamine-N5) methyltransferase, release factor-specific [Gemmatimonadota bacterium]MCH2661953.1 peptide chain release factor N(5)-glutamine methyltransferase [bacterium]